MERGGGRDGEAAVCRRPYGNSAPHLEYPLHIRGRGETRWRGEIAPPSKDRGYTITTFSYFVIENISLTYAALFVLHHL
jgi:hypothetical protein